jgi:uncharacterized protein DUF4258
MKRRIIEAARKKILYLPHTISQMSRFDRMIIVMHGEIIEDYPEDVRGHSCLLLGAGDSGRKVHVVCAPKPDYLAIITAYLPEASEWGPDFKSRRRS